MMTIPALLERRYQIECSRRVSGRTCNRYAQSQKIGKPNNF